MDECKEQVSDTQKYREIGFYVPYGHSPPKDELDLAEAEAWMEVKPPRWRGCNKVNPIIAPPDWRCPRFKALPGFAYSICDQQDPHGAEITHYGADIRYRPHYINFRAPSKPSVLFRAQIRDGRPLRFRSDHATAPWYRTM